MSPADVAARGALNALSPEAGIEKLEKALADTGDPGEQAKLQSAMAMLYAQADPPDEAAVQACFRKAMDLAPDLALKQQVAAMQAQYLLALGQKEQAQQLIGSVLAPDAPVSEAKVRLYLMLGQVHESSEEGDEAELAYVHAFRESIETEGELSPGMEGALRLSAMRLAQLYRGTGRQTEAAQVARALSVRLAGGKALAP
jgi:hypothetical protein